MNRAKDRSNSAEAQLSNSDLNAGMKRLIASSQNSSPLNASRSFLFTPAEYQPKDRDDFVRCTHSCVTSAWC